MRLIKKFSIVSALLLAVLLSACTKKGTISPLPVKHTEKASDKMPNGVYHVGFTWNDIIEENGEKYLTLEFFEYDRYDKDEFESLTIGGKIKTHKGTIKINKIEGLNDVKGNLIGYNINGDLDEGGRSFILDDDGESYRECGYDDSYITYSIGKGKFKISKDIVFADKTILMDPTAKLDEGDLYHFDNIEDAVRGCEFSPNNSYATITNNIITQIVIEWVP